MPQVDLTEFRNCLPYCLEQARKPEIAAMSQDDRFQP